MTYIIKSESKRGQVAGLAEADELDLEEEVAVGGDGAGALGSIAHHGGYLNLAGTAHLSRAHHTLSESGKEVNNSDRRSLQKQSCCSSEKIRRSHQ